MSETPKPVYVSVQKGVTPLRLHNTERSAVEFDNGQHFYIIKGVTVTEDFMKSNLHKMTAEFIDSLTNVAQRRIALELYGIAKYIQETNATLIHSDVDRMGRIRKLYKKELPDDETLMFCFVTNSSPEPDGTYAIDLLMCHPELRPLIVTGYHQEDNKAEDIKKGDRIFTLGEPQELTCHNAVASTFGLYGDEYEPDIES